MIDPSEEAAFEAAGSWRKRPKQPRAQASVDRIMQALLALIEEGGYVSATTNRIAERARVNISSLYQYFPNREAIAVALYEQTALRVAGEIRETIVQVITLPLEEGMQRMTRRLLDLMEENQMVLLRLFEEVPRLRRQAGIMPVSALSVERLGYSASMLYVAQRFNNVPKDIIAKLLYFVQNIVAGNIRQYILEPPDFITREEFITEVSGLMADYLKKSLASYAF